jgi:Second Messenger Oligonucleotide or Dinucleotide Synthetase domain
MPTTVLGGFNQLRQNIEITDLQSGIVSIRHENIRQVVEKEMTVLNSYLAGSYVRSTMISPLNKCGIDLFTILAPSYFDKHSPTNLLDRVRTILSKTYKDSCIGRSGRAVSVPFPDFAVDVVPCFNRKHGGYLIANSMTDKWISTDPLVHVTVFEKANRHHNGDLIPLLKMVREWNRGIGSGFSGFYLDLLTMDIIANVGIPNFPSAIRYIFDKGREQIKRKRRDPANFRQDVGAWNKVASVEEGISFFSMAYTRALKAEQFVKQGNVESAYGEWQKVFPSCFPVYAPD